MSLKTLSRERDLFVVSILTYNNRKMKKILLILTVVIVASCKTENVYLTVFPIKRITEITDTIYVVPDNRFKKDFHIADSLFEKASDEAMKSAHEKIKHLLKIRIWTKKKI